MLFIVGACSSLPDTPVTEQSHNAWARHQTELAEIDSWEIHARSAIFVNQKVYQVGINWQRQQDRFTLVIEAPFGQGVFRVESYTAGEKSEPVMLTLPDGQIYRDDSAEAHADQTLIPGRCRLHPLLFHSHPWTLGDRCAEHLRLPEGSLKSQLSS